MHNSIHIYCVPLLSICSSLVLHITNGSTANIYGTQSAVSHWITSLETRLSKYSCQLRSPKKVAVFPPFLLSSLSWPVHWPEWSVFFNQRPNCAASIILPPSLSHGAMAVLFPSHPYFALSCKRSLSFTMWHNAHPLFFPTHLTFTWFTACLCPLDLLAQSGWYCHKKRTYWWCHYCAKMNQRNRKGSEEHRNQ